METTIWICTGIICFVIGSFALAVDRDITKALRRLEFVLDEILKNMKNRGSHL